MELRLLQYFLAVAQEENITRASETLHISQPYLSKQMMELEDQLGKQLFIRGKRRITLTEDGVFLRKRAEEILTLVEKTEKDISGNTHEISGTIRIGGNPTSSLLKHAAKLREKYPEIRFEFYSSDAIDVIERLNHGSLDFAVLLEPVDIENFDYISLPDSSEWGLLFSVNSPLMKKNSITRDDLLKVPLIFHRRLGLQRLISKWADADIEDFNIAATYNVINGNPTKFIHNGLGYYLTTDDLLPDTLDKDVCFRPLNPPIILDYALVWKRSALLSKVAQLFLDTIK